MFVEYRNISHLWPEICLVMWATWLFVAGTFWPNRTFWCSLTAALYLVVGFALYWVVGRSHWDLFISGEALGPRGPLAVDMLGYVLRWLALGTGLLATLMISHSLREKTACEALGMIMLAVCGVMLASTATDLVLLFLGLELISIPTYILLYIGRPGRASAEATAKYFYLSILSSALLLYGFSFLYGITGTTVFYGNDLVDGIRDRLAGAAGESGGLKALAPVAYALIFAGLGFKFAAVPFHFYAPDVYQGTTNVNAGLLAVLPKIAAAVALIRLLVVAMPPSFASYAWQLVLVVAILTMTIGNVCALWQTNVRRMLGYSSIAHAGYMLIGLTVALALSSQSGIVLNYGGVGALVFYLVVYSVASLGTFAVLAHLSDERREVSTLEELAGLNKSRPIEAALLAVFMFSLAGIPPLAGFWGKLTLFTSAVNLADRAADPTLKYWLIALAVAGALNAAIAAAYYLRLVAALYFRTGTAEFAPGSGAGARAAAVICGIMVVLLGVSPSVLLSSARQAESSAMNLPESERGLAAPSVAQAD